MYQHREFQHSVRLMKLCVAPFVFRKLGQPVLHMHARTASGDADNSVETNARLIKAIREKHRFIYSFYFEAFLPTTTRRQTGLKMFVVSAKT